MHRPLAMTSAPSINAPYPPTMLVESCPEPVKACPEPVEGGTLETMALARRGAGPIYE